MVEAAPAPSFKMSQPDLLLEFLIVAFNPPSRGGGAGWKLGNVDELYCKRRQAEFLKYHRHRSAQLF